MDTTLNIPSYWLKDNKLDIEFIKDKKNQNFFLECLAKELKKKNKKEQEKNDGKAFELYVIIYHKEKYGDEIWGAGYIPEEELYNSGFIHDSNKQRLNRIARRREAEGRVILISDYGMDFLSKDKNGEYHVIQAKNYNKTKVTAKHLGTFFSVIINRVKGTSYIYTTSPLEINLEETIQHSQGDIIHEYIKDFGSSSITKHKKSTNLNEKELPLRPEQKEAIECTRGKKGQLVWNMCCAFGKTLVLGHHLEQSPEYSVIVCLAPLKAHVKNLEDRILPFLPEYASILVDSDQGGTTNPDEIKIYLHKYSQVVIFTTYKSFENILYDILNVLPKERVYIAVDEVHNLVSLPSICQYINSFPNVLFISATIPYELYDVFPDTECVYQFSLAEGIEKKYICDYEVIVPDEDMNTDTDTDTENITELSTNMDSKVYFLFNGMIKTGSRRCIVYLSSQQECDDFLERCNKISEKYHGIYIWTNKITAESSYKEREHRMKEFEADLGYDLYIFASVRILDESVNLTRCDSEFITNFSDKSSHTRIVHRLMRGGRLDSNNPSKKNHLFLWAPDESLCKEPFSLLRKQDPEFHKKIRAINTNYDNNTKKTTKEKLKKITKKWSDFVQYKCRTLDEHWEARRQHWIQQYQKLGKYPSQISKDPQEKKAGKWQSDMRNGYNKKHKRITQERIDILDATEGWRWDEDSFDLNLENWIFQYKKLSKYPSRESKDPDEKRTGQWQASMRKGYNKKEKWMTQERINKLNNTEGWKWDEKKQFKKETFESNLERWINQYKKHIKEPSNISKDQDERKAGQWRNKIREKYKNKQLSKKYIDILDATEGWKWSQEDPFDSNLENWIFQYKKLEKSPSSKSKDVAEKKSGQWQEDMRRHYKNKENWMTQERIDKLNSTEGWIWESKDNFYDNLSYWIQQYKRLERCPSCMSKDIAEAKAGRWQTHMRTAFRKKEKRLTQERIDKLNSTEGWKWAEEDPFDSNLENWIYQYQKLEKSPSSLSTDPDEKRAGIWRNTMRQHYKKKTLTQEQIDKFNATEGWTWEDDPFESNLENWIQQYKKLGKNPSGKSKDPKEKRAGRWQGSMRNGYRIKAKWMTQKRIDILNNTDCWAWGGR